MPADRFVYFDAFDKMPTKEEVRLVCEDFVAGLGTVEWQESGHRFFIKLAGSISHPLNRVCEKHGVKQKWVDPEFTERVIEVFLHDKPERDAGPAIDVMTREQDEVTSVIAGGLADLFARFWKGRRDD